MDRRLSGHSQGHSQGHGGPDARTPLAWQHRDQVYQQGYGYHSDMAHSTHSGQSTPFPRKWIFFYALFSVLGAKILYNIFKKTNVI